MIHLIHPIESWIALGLLVGGASRLWGWPGAMMALGLGILLAQRVTYTLERK